MLGFYYDRTGTGLFYEASARLAGDDPLRTRSLRSYWQLLETCRLLASQGALGAQLASLALRPPSAVRGSAVVDVILVSLESQELPKILVRSNSSHERKKL